MPTPQDTAAMQNRNIRASRGMVKNLHKDKSLFKNRMRCCMDATTHHMVVTVFPLSKTMLLGRGSGAPVHVLIRLLLRDTVC